MLASCFYNSAVAEGETRLIFRKFGLGFKDEEEESYGCSCLSFFKLLVSRICVHLLLVECKGLSSTSFPKIVNSFCDKEGKPSELLSCLSSVKTLVSLLLLFSAEYCWIGPAARKLERVFYDKNEKKSELLRLVLFEFDQTLGGFI